MDEYTVRDGSRSLRFTGTQLSCSSSQQPSNVRWVEFELYRTAGGQYVLARTGVSKCLHTPGCETAKRNRTQSVHVNELNMDTPWVRCTACGGHASQDGYVSPEQPRYWAQTSSTARGVLESLYKSDQYGTEYLTHVAKRLLEDAAEQDAGIRDVYFSETLT